MYITEQSPGHIRKGVNVVEIVNQAEERRRHQVEREHQRETEERLHEMTAPAPLYFIFFYKLHCHPWPDEYLIVICCFICMLYNLGLYNRNSRRRCCTSALCSPRGSFRLPQKRAREGEKSLLSKKDISSDAFCPTCRSAVCYCAPAGSCI